jgi:hypothetical protein
MVSTTMSDVDPTITASASDVPRPTNTLVTPLLTDLCQLPWRTLTGRRAVDDPAVFELFFRKNRGGEIHILLVSTDASSISPISNYR